MRMNFDRQLDHLNIELIKMGSLCEEAIGKIGIILTQNDMTLIEQVFELEEQTDRKHREIENLCMKLIMQQQPVAGDFRIVSSTFKMISDLERIGDQASDIAEILGYIGGKTSAVSAVIADMARACIKMLTDSIDSFVKRDADTAKKVMDYDDVVDDLFTKAKIEITEMIRNEPENGELCIDLLMIAKYFERIGDHTTNIAEWVQYAVTGKYKEN